jgi:MoxR-like ATPase
MELLELSLQPNPNQLPEPVVNPQQLQQITEAAAQVLVANSVREAAVALIQATQPAADNRHRIRHGVSPRGLQALVKSAQAHALLGGRSHVALEDLAAVSLPALRHRLLLSHEAELEGLTSDQVLADIVAVWQGAQTPR